MKDALSAKMTTLPEQLRRSLTWDRGKELSQHEPSKSRPASRSTAPILAVLGNAAATRTPTDSCANTSRRALTSRAGTLKRLTQLRPCSTADPASPLVGRHPPKPSMSMYFCSRRPVLRRLMESAQYLAIRYTERLAEAGVVNSVGSKGDSYDCEDPGVVINPALGGSRPSLLWVA
jgi:hypothetical protein